MIHRLTKEEDAQYQQMSLAELEEYEEIALELYSRIGELRLQKYLQSTSDIDLIDEDEAGYIKMATGEVIQNPDGIRIFAYEYPPRLQNYAHTKFSEKIGISKTRERWRRIITDGLRDIEKIGYNPPNGRFVIVYKFHFKRLADPDNRNIRILNDIFRDSWLFNDDNCDNLVSFMCGVVDPKNPGIEITIIPESEFLKYPQIISNNN
ncbi:hypothetical protein [Syntrophomonas palmitatica]|uniref:hypothetical protein n=1 Tax=Syntrophomonas palmitatica TaxID=402877 RepID=UPI0006D1AAC2|nr:hypothetical protein [Syntrophomonas palmitatica]